MKLRISTNTGDSRTSRGLPKSVCTPWGGRRAQGPCWDRSSGSSGSSRGRRPTLAGFAGRHKCQLEEDVRLESCAPSVGWGKSRAAGREAASQAALRDAPKRQWGQVNVKGFGERGVQYHETLILQKVFRWSRGSDEGIQCLSRSEACKD